MQIRHKISLQFTCVVAIILLFFSGIVYLRAENQRSKNFFDRIQGRANTTARLLVDVQEFTPKLLKLLDMNSSSRLPNEEVFVYNFKNELLYSNVDKTPDYIDPTFLENIKKEEKVTLKDENREILGILFTGKYDRFVVVASASDLVGYSQEKNLVNTLGIGFLSGIIITIILSIFFAGQALRPIQSINNEISRITANNLKKRLDEGNKKDEIAELAVNFNRMLNRLEMAFQQQKQFVSQASHELRTPLAALKTEIQVGLEENQTIEEYKKTLKNTLNDTERLIQLSNSLLQLARTIEDKDKFHFEILRMEDILLNVQKAIQGNYPHYRIVFDFEKIPDDDNLTLINGNLLLLENLFSNLIENACKYSSDHQANILLSFDKIYCIVKIKDKGIGIPENEIAYIFNPFFRASNSIDKDGFGIGLSITKRIAELHKAIIDVKSKYLKGTEFIIKIPHQ